MANKYNRRILFKMLVSRNLNSTDPLFEKYRRINYSIRKYSSSETARKGPIMSGLTPYIGAWTTWEASYLLRRTQFGLKKADVDLLVSIGMSSSVDTLLNFTNTTPSPPINYYQPTFADENNLPYGSDWSNNAFASTSIGATTNSYRTKSLSAWNLELAIHQELNIREKIISIQSEKRYCNLKASSTFRFKPKRIISENSFGKP